MSSFLDPKALQSLVAAQLQNSPPAEVREAPEQPKKGASWWAHLANAGGAAADLGSTMYALKQPGLREANPIYGDNPSMGKIMGAKAGTAALSALMMHFMPHKLANVMGVGSGLFQGGIAAHNLSEVNKIKK